LLTKKPWKVWMKLLTKIFKSIWVHFFPLKSLINILSDICCSF
jgi:hypothetical protein